MSESIREEIRVIILEVRQYLCNTEFAEEPFTKPVESDWQERFIKKTISYLKSQIEQMENPYLEDSTHSSGWNACQNMMIAKLQ